VPPTRGDADGHTGGDCQEIGQSPGRALQPLQAFFSWGIDARSLSVFLLSAGAPETLPRLLEADPRRRADRRAPWRVLSRPLPADATAAAQTHPSRAPAGLTGPAAHVDRARSRWEDVTSA